MAWRYSEDRFVDGDIVTHFELMKDIEAVSTEVNGHLDRDNLGLNIVGTDELAVGACSTAKFKEMTTTQLLGSPLSGSAWEELTELSMDIDCVGGILQATANVSFYGTAGDTARVLVALIVDGSFVCVEESANGGMAPSTSDGDTAHIFADVPVGRGSVSVVVLCKTLFWTGDAYARIVAQKGCLEARNVRR